MKSIKITYSFLIAAIIIFAQSTIISQNPNQSLHFDGVDDYVSFSASTTFTNNSYTIEFWAKKEIGAFYDMVFAKGTNLAPNEYMHIGWVGATTIRFAFFSNDLDAPVVDDGLWHHYAFTYDSDAAPGSDNRFIYQDGVLLASDESAPFTGSARIEIGRAGLLGGNSNFHGSIDQVAFYLYDKSAQQIQDQMFCETNFISLVELYSFNDDPTGTTLKPLDGNPVYNGTLQNFALSGATSNWTNDTGYEITYIDGNIEDQSVSLGEDVTLTANMVIGDCPSENPSYQWYFNDEVIPNETSTTLLIEDVTVEDFGTYKLEVEVGFYTSFFSNDIQVNLEPALFATEDSSDYYIDINWDLPINPCLLDGSNMPYDEVTLQLLRDGVQIEFQTIEGELLEDIYENDTPILGSFRDFVGPELTHQYQLLVFVGPFGNIDFDCSNLTTQGSTGSVRPPINFSATTDQLDKIATSWTNKSDLTTSFKLYRDGSLIETITEGIGRDSVLSFEDLFVFNSPSSIESGKSYEYSIEMNSSITNETSTYNIGSGKTIDIQLQASKTEEDRVDINWLNIASSQIDAYQLFRNNKLFAVKSINEVNHVDALPLKGDSSIYQLRLIDEEEIVASYADNGFALPNGVITGRVVTEEGNYPRAGVTVHAIRNETGDTTTVITDDSGFFSFSELPYGLLDSFELKAIKGDETFEYFPNQSIGLSVFQNTFSNVVITSDFSYSQGSSQHEIDVVVERMPDQDLADIQWNYSTNAPEVFFDIRRNGLVVYTDILTGGSNVSDGFQDLGGTPGEDTRYEVRIFDINGNQLSSVQADTTIIFPKVSRVPDGNFTVVETTLSNGTPIGNLTLEWTHTSQNIDGFRIYRNGDLVSELPPSETTFVDREAPFDTDLTYNITAIRQLGITTFETEIPTPVTPANINLGPMPTPEGVLASSTSAVPSSLVQWVAPNLGILYDFTGFCIYRNGELLRKYDKSMPYFTNDFEAVGMTNILYEVSAFRQLENGIIESERIAALPIDHEPVGQAPPLQALALPAEGKIQLSWDISTYFNFDGYQLYYNGMFLDSLPFYITYYEHRPSSNSNHNYELYCFKHIDGNNILSDVPSTASVSMSQSNGNVYPPQNFTASRDLPNHIKLCWEYLDFIESSFEVWKDGEILDTLPVGARTYYDYTANKTNHIIDYKIRAFQQGQTSKFVGAVGDVKGAKVVYGQVTETHTKIGIQDAAISIDFNGPKIIAVTDSAGYFRYEFSNELEGQDLYIAATYVNGLVSGVTIPINEAPSYRVSLELDLPDVFDYSNPAHITFANIDFNEYDFEGILSWQLNNDLYDGVEIYRGFDVIADVSKTEGNLFIDTTVVPGISYDYIFRAYQNTVTGKIYTDAYTQSFTYSAIAPVINLSATPLPKNNAIQVQWSHLYDHADAYVILRNGIFMSEVFKGQPFTFTDTTGTTGEQYTYTLRGYKLSGDQIYFSEPRSVDVTFPKPALVCDVVLSAPLLENIPEGNGNFIAEYNLNHIQIDWDYEGANVSGFKIFRDGILIQQLPKNIRSYKDYEGIPGIETTYTISALVNQNGKLSESDGVDQFIVFPTLSSPYEAVAVANTTIGNATISWKYQTAGIDYFKIFKYSGTLQEEVTIPVNEDVEEETTFEYVDNLRYEVTDQIYYIITANSVRNGVVYESNGIQTTNISNPIPQITMCEATRGVFDQAVQIKWDAEIDINVDSFTIVKFSIPEQMQVESFTVPKGTRSYFEIFSEGSDVDSFEYIVYPGRIIDGTYTVLTDPNIENGSNCSSVGYPGCVISGPLSFATVGSTGYGNSVAIDGEWMAVGSFLESKVYLYHFENGSWQYYTALSANVGNWYGFSVDISDQLLVIGAPLDNSGSIQIYRLYNGGWAFDNYIQSPANNRWFGYSVSIDNEKIAVGHGLILPGNTPLQETYQSGIRVFVRDSGCDYSMPCSYQEIPVNPYAIDTNNPYLYPYGSFNVDIEGDFIVAGVPEARYSVSNREYGLAAVYKIEQGFVEVQQLITDFDSIPNGPEEKFGSDVEYENGKIAISSVEGIAPNGNIGGKVGLYEYYPESETWINYQTIYSDAPLNQVKFGQCIKWKNDLLGISEPNITANNPISSRLYLFQENSNNLFEILQSPNPNDANYREAFYDSGSPDIYAGGFGFSFDFSDYHIGVGAPQLDAPKFYPFKLFDFYIDDVNASDGLFNQTRVTWSLEGCDGCPDDFITEFKVYRDSIHVGNVSGSMYQFIDEPGNLIPGAQEAVAGKEYFYEVEAITSANFDFKSKKAGDIGYSKRGGRLAGDVFVIGTNTGVPNVDIQVTGVDSTEGVTYTYQTTTLADGSFVVSDIYIGSDILYTLEPSYLDHNMEVSSGNTFLLTEENPEENFIVVFDNTAYVVKGKIDYDESNCGIENILVNYYHSINGVESFVDTAMTDENGFYSFIVNPNIANLTEIRIQADDIQANNVENGDTTIIQYDFSPEEVTFNSFDNFPIQSIANFQDVLKYPVTIRVENTCGNPLANQPIVIGVSSDDGCFEMASTTDALGELTLELAPKSYLLSVEDIVGSGVDNYENAGIVFLNQRPVVLDLFEIHAGIEDADTLPQIPPVKFVYHRGLNFAYTSTFDRYLCDLTQNPAILTQGDTYQMDFILSENHRPGENCAISDGYLIVRNSGAEIGLDTLYFENGSFETYEFTAGIPNLSEPYTWAVSIQYFSNEGSLLGNTNIPIIVEGQRLLPGTGIITDALTDESGDLQMPLMVLRDPPGDGSYSTIESGTTISKSLEFSDESSGSLGFYLDSEFSILGAGAFANVDVGVGGSNSNSAAFNFDLTTTQSYSTSSSDGAVGRGANVIVGAGLSTQYGLTQVLSFDDNCEPNKFKIMSFGIGGFNSTYAYTVSFIEQLIQGYRRDSMLVEMGLLPVIRPDGNPYTKDEARSRFTALIDSWEEMLHYHDVETVPHYVLCQDFSYRDDLDATTEALYDGWKNGFCNQIGYYVGDEFFMDDEITWTPDLINSYNNAIAFTDEIKGLPRDYIDNGDLNVTNYDIEANNLSITNQYHNLLGNNAKSAEVFDFSGDVSFSKTVTAQQSSSTSKSFSRYFYLDIAAGAAVENKTLIGLGLFSLITNIKAKIGARIKANAKISVSKAQAESNASTISYHIFDDDPEDQITFLALQAPLQDQTPYFIRLGGLSSCPSEEPLTINQDNAPLLIDNPTIRVVIETDNGIDGTTRNPNPVHNVQPGEAAVFEIRLNNEGPTGLTRDAEVFLDPVSNPFGAIIKLGGSNLNTVSPVFSIPAGVGITQFLTVERPNATPFYVFEGLRIGIRPECGGEAEFIELDVYFETPCSPVSLVKPFDGFVVNRINPQDLNDQEFIPFDLRDFDPENEQLQYIQLEYQRIGTGSGWQNVPGGRINKSVLLSENNNLAFGEDPSYLFEWNITGQYNLYPDGAYKVRAFAFCGTSGRQYSNEVSITLARSGQLITGFPEPADGLWTSGDEISVTYITDIDCGLYNVLDSSEIMDYISLIDLETMMPVPFTHFCQNNKLVLLPLGDMSAYDGHQIRASYTNITNIIGDNTQDVVWDFEVITQDVDWDEDVLEVTIFENEIKTISTFLINTTGSPVNGLTLTGLESWYTFSPEGLFSVPSDGRLVDLVFTGNVPPGNYSTTLQVNNLVGRTPTLTIQLTVLNEVPVPEIAEYTDSMELIMNWSFLQDPISLSTDLNDMIQVYQNGQIRGYATIEEQGNFYFARIMAYGNAEDENQPLDFVIWNADENKAYLPVSSTNIPFRPNTIRGVLTNPEVLLVEDEEFVFGKRIYVDSMNITGLKDGLSWETAFNDLQDALEVANDLDTIWMAKGTYYPSISNRSISFNINKSISILGGFQNGMTSASQRTGNDETILSGNIGVRATNEDNSYHVVKSSAQSLMIDYVTLAEGNANGSNNNGFGGCLMNTGEVTLSNCIMRNGKASMEGELIYNSGLIIIDGGLYSIPEISQTSNVYNDGQGSMTIKQNVEIRMID